MPVLPASFKSSSASGASAHPLSATDRRALAATLLAVALSTLDASIANTALPVIAADLNASPAASIWVINAFQLAVVATLLPFAALGDLLGPRRVFLGGLAFYTAASLLSALADSLWLLAAGRALQGIGAGALMSVNVALVRLFYPPAQLGRGLGLNALVVGVAFSAGPSVASLVLAVGNWHWLFAINVPLGLFGLALAYPSLPRSTGSGHGFDPLTALLTTLTFASLILGLSNGAQREAWPWVLGPLLLALVACVLLLRRQAGHPAPMLPVDLLRRPMFALSALTALGAFATQSLAYVSLPFYFHSTLHLDPVDTGLLMTCWPVVVAMAAPIAGRLSDRYPPGLLGGIGMLIMSAGMVALALLPADPKLWDITLRMSICGLGFGFYQSPNMRALMASAPPERSGGASGMVAMVRLTGQTIGAALVALCFGLIGGGTTLALWLGAVFAALAAVASSARLWLR